MIKGSIIPDKQMPSECGTATPRRKQRQLIQNANTNNTERYKQKHRRNGLNGAYKLVMRQSAVALSSRPDSPKAPTVTYMLGHLACDVC